MTAKMNLTDEVAIGFFANKATIKEALQQSYEAGRASEQAAVAKWLDERGKYCEGVADEHVDDHQTCCKWEIRAHESFTSAAAVLEGLHK